MPVATEFVLALAVKPDDFLKIKAALLAAGIQTALISWDIRFRVCTLALPWFIAVHAVRVLHDFDAEFPHSWKRCVAIGGGSKERRIFWHPVYLSLERLRQGLHGFHSPRIAFGFGATRSEFYKKAFRCCVVGPDDAG